MISGLIRSISALFFIWANKLDKAGRAAALNFLSIIVGYASDMLFFDYHISLGELIGSLVIITCSVSLFVLKLVNYSE